MKKKIFYFGLEPLKSRYTAQLSQEWMPDTFNDYNDVVEFVDIPGCDNGDQQIKVGAVLDAVGRGKYSMSQCSYFLDLLNNGYVNNGDIVFLQDFYTPGIDSVFYALDLYKINVKFYSMLHAQSVDEYDFTWPMRSWLRPIELSIDSKMNGIFVGSTIHKEQLRQAGFNAPIHVVSLPLHLEKTKNVIDSKEILPGNERKNVIMFSSRFDKEKNPFFMLEVAEAFLQENESYEWHITTSGSEIRSSLPGVIEAIKSLAERQPRFIIKSNITKEEYYTELAQNKVLFNTSLQDYVSWTVLEGDVFGIDFIAPDFRSFKEFVPAHKVYTPFNVNSALDVLNNAILMHESDYNYAETADLGRRIEGWIVVNDPSFEINVWHEAELCKQLLKQKNSK